MKFIKIHTKHTEAELDAIVESLDKGYLDLMLRLYKSFKYVEGIDKNGHVYMYAIMWEETAKELCEHYVNLEIAFEYTDITKQIKYYDTAFFPKEERTAELVAMVFKYVEVHLDTNDILEKISELGGSLQLTDLDLKKLKEH